MTEPPAIDARRHRGHVRVDLTKVIEEIERAVAEPDTPVVSFVPPIQCDHAARRRFSISRLRSTLGEVLVDSDDLPHATPITVSADERAAIELGNLVHAALAGFDFDGDVDVARHVAIYGDKLRVSNDSVRGLARRTSGEVSRFTTGRQAGQGAVSV